MGRKLPLMLALFVAGAGLADAPYEAAMFDADGALQRPRDTRELVYVTSGVGMAYGPARELAAGQVPPFTNVLVTPAAYRAFMDSGKWPEGTAFFLEVRPGQQHVSIDNNGSSQGRLVALEAAVKDSKRFAPGGWAYFDFGRDGKEASAKALPQTASCYACHSKHGAVEWTFTQFYPDQFEVARQRGTIRTDYDPAIKAN